MIRNLIADLVLSLRILRGSPGFALVAVLSLALGSGAMVTLFGVVEAGLLRPLEVAQPQSFVTVWTADADGSGSGSTSYLDYLDIEAKSESLSGMTAYTWEPFDLGTADDVERVWGNFVTPRFFDVVGVPLSHGRAFAPDEVADGHPAPVVVLSHALWKRRFGGDERILGTTVDLRGRSFTVIGVAAPGFHGVMRGLRIDLFLPLATRPLFGTRQDVVTTRDSRGFAVAARLRPGVDIDRAQAELDVIAADLARAYPEAWKGHNDSPRKLSISSEADSRLPGKARTAFVGFIGLLMGVAGMVLLIACTNITNLLLARTARRQKEIALRLALGATRAELIRQFVLEAMLLSLLGVGLGLLLSHLALSALSSIVLPIQIPVVFALRVDGRVVLFALGLALLIGLGVGVVPALHASRPNLASVLAADGLAVTGGKASARLREAFVIGEVALALVLLASAGAFTSSLRHAIASDPGFDKDGLSLVAVGLHGSGSTDKASAELLPARIDEMKRAVAAVPAVRSAALSSDVPLGLGTHQLGVSVDGDSAGASAARSELSVTTSLVDTDYFATLGVPLIEGRGFQETDRAGGLAVAIVNQAFAQRCFPGRSAIGEHISVVGERRQIVGIARTGKYKTLGEEPQPYLYLPVSQLPAMMIEHTDLLPATLFVRTDPNAATALDGVRRALTSRGFPVFSVRSADQHLGFALFPARVAAYTLGSLAAVGLFLACMGIYGVMSFVTGQRTREIGIRIALGAFPAQVVREVVARGMRSVAVGAALGLAASALLAPVWKNLLYDVDPRDPRILITVTISFFASALIACFLPARRAASMEPMLALRSG